MPKKRRDYAKRNAGYALRNTDRVLDRLLVLKELFTEHHPKYAEFIQNIMEGQLMVQNQVEELCRHAWGGVPKRVEQWTGSGGDYRKQKQAEREAESNNESNDSVHVPEMQGKKADYNPQA